MFQEKNKNVTRLLTGLIIGLLLVGSYASAAVVHPVLWTLNGDGNTIVLNNSANNVNLGENKTTSFKLRVNGNTMCNGSLNMSDTIRMNNKAISWGTGLVTPPYTAFGLTSSNKALMDVLGNYYRDFWFGSSALSLNISGGYPNPIATINLYANGTIKNTKDLFVFGNEKIRRNLTITKNLDVGYNATFSGSNSNNYMRWEKLNNTIKLNNTASGSTRTSPSIVFGARSEKAYINYYSTFIAGGSALQLYSPSDISLTGNNIKLNGATVFLDNVKVGFGGSGSFYPYLNMFLRYGVFHIEPISWGVAGETTKIQINNKSLNVDFVINGTSGSQFDFDAGHNNFNITKVNVTSLLTIPCIRTGDTLTSYQIQGSIVLNVTTNYLGTYSGSAWRWR